MTTRRFNKQQAQIIAACDFKHLEYEEESGDSRSSNGALIELRATLRALGETAVATFVQGLSDVGSDLGTATGEPGFADVSIYAQQVQALENMFGNQFDGTSGTIATDIAELNSILRELELAVSLMNFARIAAGGELAEILAEYYDSEKTTIISDAQADYANPAVGGNYFTKLRPNATYPDSYSGYMESLGFNEGIGENFSSTKWFIQLLQGLGFSARRFVPSLCTEAEVKGDNDDGTPYCIYPVPQLDPDILLKLSVVAGDKFGGNMPTFYPTEMFFHHAATAVAGVADHMEIYKEHVREVDGGGGGLDAAMKDLIQIESGEQGLTRLIMLLSRELSNSTGLAYYQSDAQTAIRERLESGGGVTISVPSPEDGSTYAVDSTNLVHNLSKKSPFGTQYPPCDITSTGVTVDGVAPNPKGFFTCEVDETGFPGNVTGKTKCSLFEPNDLAMEDGSFIAGTRDFFLAAFFDKDEVVSIRELGGVLGDHPNLSRLTRTQHEFTDAMVAYRDYLIDMTALQAVDDNVTTTPRAIIRRLFCNESLKSLMFAMTQADIVQLEEDATIEGHGAPEDFECFVAGTRIAVLVDGALDHVFIEDVVVGAEVLSYNFSEGKVEPRKVTRTSSSTHSGIVEFVFSDGTFTKHTFDHPYYVVGEGWSSYAPNLTNARYKHEDLRNTRAMLVGDECMTVDGGTARLIEINEQASEPTQTYNFNVEGNENYFADGVLVHNKTMEEEKDRLDDVELVDLMNTFETQAAPSFDEATPPDGVIIP